MTASGLRELLYGEPLTDREVDVLYGVALGETGANTAERLFLSTETVRDYRKKAVAKLGARNLYHAVALAIGTGIIDISKIMDNEV